MLENIGQLEDFEYLERCQVLEKAIVMAGLKVQVSVNICGKNVARAPIFKIDSKRHTLALLDPPN